MLYSNNIIVLSSTSDVSSFLLIQHVLVSYVLYLLLHKGRRKQCKWRSVENEDTKRKHSRCLNISKKKRKERVMDNLKSSLICPVFPGCSLERIVTCYYWRAVCRLLFLRYLPLCFPNVNFVCLQIFLLLTFFCLLNR